MMRLFTRVIFLFLTTCLLLVAPDQFEGSHALGASSFTFILKEDESVFSEYWAFIRNVNIYDPEEKVLHEEMDVLVVNEHIRKVSETPMYFVDVDLTYNINGEGRTLLAGIFAESESTAIFEVKSFIQEGTIADIIVIDLNPVEDPNGLEKILRTSGTQELQQLNEVYLIMKAGDIIKNTLPDTKVHRMRLQQYREKRKIANEKE